MSLLGFVVAPDVITVGGFQVFTYSLGEVCDHWL